MAKSKGSGATARAMTVPATTKTMSAPKVVPQAAPTVSIETMNARKATATAARNAAYKAIKNTAVEKVEDIKNGPFRQTKATIAGERWQVGRGTDTLSLDKTGKYIEIRIEPNYSSGKKWRLTARYFKPGTSINAYKDITSDSVDSLIKNAIELRNKK